MDDRVRKQIEGHIHEQASKAERLAMAPQHVRDAFFKNLSPKELTELESSWEFWGRPNQQPPRAAEGVCQTPGCGCEGRWVYWLILAGRGWGKTRTGAEWIHQQVDQFPRAHLIGATEKDVRQIMVEGESGILATQKPSNPCVYKPTRNLIEWQNGAVAILFSADEPERLRGPQAYVAWADELAAWRYEESWSQLQLGMRLGPLPRTIITTTPRPRPLVKRLVNDPLTHITKGSTFDNISNLSKTFINEITAKFEGTRFGRQEIYAEILDESELALWSRELIDKQTLSFEDMGQRSARDWMASHRWKKIVVGVDPAMTYGEKADETGIVVVGQRADNGYAYVLDDLSGKYRPEEWAKHVVRAYKEWGANKIVAEKNQGGDLVERNILVEDQSVPVKLVHASKNKITRAEPVSTAYERGRVWHLGAFPDMEEQMVTWEAGDVNSPDRLDALVWAVTEVIVGNTIVAIAALGENELAGEGSSYWRNL